MSAYQFILNYFLLFYITYDNQLLSNMSNNQPKTIQDYQDVVKILKLKILKQNKKIQELQTKNKQYQDDINNASLTLPQSKSQMPPSAPPKDFDTSTLKGKAAVMYLYSQGSKKLGITPQSIFRIADFSYRNQIQADYFRSVLSKINLNLTPKQISCLIFIFDENCSGYISKQDYINSLHAYQVAVQESCLPYTQECLLKLANLFNQDKMNLSKFFDEMDTKVKKSGKVDANVFEEQVKKTYQKKIKEREIIGAFNEIDLQSEGFINKTNFLYCVTSFINRLILGEDMGPKKTGITAGQTSPNKNINNSNIKGSFINEQESDIHEQLEKTSALETLQNKFNVKLSSIYEQLVRLSFDKRITLRKFKLAALQVNKQLSLDLISHLFKQIDEHQKGSIYIAELIKFFLKNNKDTDIVFRVLGKYFFSNDLSAEKFMFSNSFEAESDISKTKFIEIMEKSFPIGAVQLWEIVWSAFDKGNKGVANVGSIIQTLKKYES